MNTPNSSSPQSSSPAPQSGAVQMSLQTDRTLLRGPARSTRYLLVTINAPRVAPREGRLPLNVGIVLDRSGSMDGARKFDLAREAVEQSLRMLKPQDRFTLVVFDTEIDTLTPLTPASARATRSAMTRLKNVEPRGGTDLHGGWMAGGGQLLNQLMLKNCNNANGDNANGDKANGDKANGGNGISRVLLLTDGQANCGVVDNAELQAVASDLRKGGVATTTFGVGEDFDERLLRDIALEGGGQFYFIETPAQIADLLTSELGEALEVVRRGAVLQIALPPGAEGELLNRYRTSHAAGDNELRIELGDLTSGQELQLVVRVTFPEDREGAVALVRAGVGGAASLQQETECELSWTYADHAANDAQRRDVIVDREVAQQYAARARAQATEWNRVGDLRKARRVIEATARRIRQYANGDAELELVWRELLAEVERYAERQMSSMEIKSAFYASDIVAKSRGPQGKARR